MVQSQSLLRAITLVLTTLTCCGAFYIVRGSAIFSPGELNADSVTEVSLGGVRSHAELRNRCAACHPTPWSGETMEQRCLGCHTQVAAQLADHAPLHGKLTNGQDCRACHTEHEGAHGKLTDYHSFLHDATGFPLLGKHEHLACAKCHREGERHTEIRTCYNCHAEPAVHRGKYGTACGQCHTALNWKQVNPLLTELAKTEFNHDATGFPLVGKHEHLACAKCHREGERHTEIRACYNCHAEPAVHRGRYGTACGHCHTALNWKQVNPQLTELAKTEFNHDATKFPLTGAHRTTGCVKCHTSNVFRGLAQSCVSCHADPVVHRGKFGLDCAKCHSTTTWKGAFIAHKFPLNHGGGPKHVAKACATCHQQADYKTYTCYGCHRHDPDKTEEKHRKRAILNLTDCAACHPNGRKKRNEATMHLPVHRAPGGSFYSLCEAEHRLSFGDWQSDRILRFHSQAIGASLTPNPQSGIHTAAAASDGLGDR